MCTPCSVGSFSCPDLSLPIPSPGRKRSSVDFLLYSDSAPPPRLLQRVSSCSMWLSTLGVLSVPPFLHFSEGGPFFLCAFLLCQLSVLYFSVTQLLVDKLRSFSSDVLLLFFLLSSWFHQCAFSRHCAYLMMTHITP